MKLRSITAHLLILVFLATALPVAVLFLFAHQQARHMSLAVETQSMENVAESAAQTLHRRLLESLRTVRQIAGRNDVLLMLQSDAYEPGAALMRDAMAASGWYWAVFAFDRNGTIRAGNTADGQDLRAISIGNRDYYKAILSEKDFYISDVFQPRTGDMAAFSIAAPVHDGAGLLQGGAVAVVDLAPFAGEIAASLRYRGDGRGVILDADNRYIAGGRPLAPAAEAQHLPQEHATSPFTVQYGPQDRPMLLAMDSVPISNWKVLLVVPGASLEQAVLRTLQRTAHPKEMLVAGAVLFIVMAGLALAWLKGFVLGPWRQSIQYASDMAKGTPLEEPNDPYMEDLRQITGCLRNMANDLKNAVGFARGLLQGIGFPCLVTDPDGRIIHVNKPMLALVGRENEANELLDASASSVFAFTPGWKDITASVRENEETCLVYARSFSGAQGRTRLVGAVQPFYDLQGANLGLVSVWCDISNQERRAEGLENRLVQIEEHAAAETATTRALRQAARQTVTQLSGPGQALNEEIGLLQQAMQAAKSSLQPALQRVEEKAALELQAVAATKRCLEQFHAVMQNAKQRIGEDSRLLEATENAVRRAIQSEDALRRLDRALGPFSLLVQRLKNLAVQANLMALKTSSADADFEDPRRLAATAAEEAGLLAHDATRMVQDVRKWLAEVDAASQDMRAASRFFSEAAREAFAHAGDGNDASQTQLQLCQTLQEQFPSCVHAVTETAEIDLFAPTTAMEKACAAMDAAVARTAAVYHSMLHATNTAMGKLSEATTESERDKANQPLTPKR